MEQSKGIKIVFLMCLGIFLCMIDTTIMNIALPAIQSSVNTSLEKMSWVLNGLYNDDCSTCHSVRADS
ncbi:hypothetical protein bcgnr5386_02830 [Bacillus cereus]